MSYESTPDIGMVKNYWDNRPCNIRHSPKPVGSPDYCLEVRARRYFVEPHIWGFAGFPKWKGKKVLEVGCGIGTDSAMFAESGALLTSIEFSTESLAVCRQCFDALGLSARFYTGNAEELSSIVPVEPFDLVYSFGVIHHTPHPERIISEVQKYMHSGSELRIMLYAKYSWKSLMILLGFDQPEAQSGCPIAKTYSAREVRELLKNFQIIAIEKSHIFPYRIPEYKEYRYVKTFPWNVLPSWCFEWLKRKFGWHLLITARLK